MSTPSAETIAGFDAPARISMPTRVRWITRYSATPTARPTAMMAKRYDG